MAIVPRQHITQQKIAEHVQRLGELYPPIRLDSVDRTIKRPWLVAKKFGHVIDYLARVELEVDRNVLELLVLLPDADDTNKTFYADVWQPQEIQHGLILDRLQQDLGRTAAEPIPQAESGAICCRWAKPNNSLDPSAPTIASNPTSGQPPNQTTPSATGMATTAKEMRWKRLEAMRTAAVSR